MCSVWCYNGIKKLSKRPALPGSGVSTEAPIRANLTEISRSNSELPNIPDAHGFGNSSTNQIESPELSSLPQSVNTTEEDQLPPKYEDIENDRVLCPRPVNTNISANNLPPKYEDIQNT